MATSSQAVLQYRIARQVREQFVNTLDASIIELMGLMQNHLGQLAQGGGAGRSVAEIQLAMEAAALFRAERQHWVATVRREWREALIRMGSKTGNTDMAGLSLVDDELVERKIAASRLAAGVAEAAGAEFNNLRLRMQFLERRSDLPADDVFKPETLAQIMVKAWTDCGLTRPTWALVHPAAQAGLARRLPEAFRQANEWLVQQGVMAEIDLKSLVRRADGEAGGISGAGVGASGGAGQRPSAWSASPQPSVGGPGTGISTSACAVFEG